MFCFKVWVQCIWWVSDGHFAHLHKPISCVCVYIVYRNLYFSQKPFVVKMLNFLNVKVIFATESKYTLKLSRSFWRYYQKKYIIALIAESMTENNRHYIRARVCVYVYTKYIFLWRRNVKLTGTIQIQFLLQIIFSIIID